MSTSNWQPDSVHEHELYDVSVAVTRFPIIWSRLYQGPCNCQVIDPTTLICYFLCYANQCNGRHYTCVYGPVISYQAA